VELIKHSDYDVTPKCDVIENVLSKMANT